MLLHKTLTVTTAKMFKWGQRTTCTVLIIPTSTLPGFSVVGLQHVLRDTTADSIASLIFRSGCTMDRLLISKNGDPQLAGAEPYCLITSYYSSGGTFLCTLTAQRSSTPNTCSSAYCWWHRRQPQ
ncbi:unnamed protein product [Leptidea sinapis]|uniref:Uncharacterized protein n=1 Tax=Leptidea sinapis TaxID=189913 RepID=A0A5E4QQU2_9NEOP|nr:unnamed protein product [Leptidea sinapis]